jgi:hypothetical protein
MMMELTPCRASRPPLIVPGLVAHLAQARFFRSDDYVKIGGRPVVAIYNVMHMLAPELAGPQGERQRCAPRRSRPHRTLAAV